MFDKEIIKNVVELFPSDELRNAYRIDFKNNIYPSWDEYDIMSILNALLYYAKLENILSVMLSLSKNIDNQDVKNNIIRIYKKLMHKGIRFGNTIDDYFEFSKYVIIKNIFKSGDLIKYYDYGKAYYGIVGNFDYDKYDMEYAVGKAYFDYTDIVYYSHVLHDDFDAKRLNDNNYLYDILSWHHHPCKFIVKKAYESELNRKQLQYAEIVKNRCYDFIK